MRLPRAPAIYELRSILVGSPQDKNPVHGYILSPLRLSSGSYAAMFFEIGMNLGSRRSWTLHLLPGVAP